MEIGANSTRRTFTQHTGENRLGQKASLQLPKHGARDTGEPHGLVKRAAQSFKVWGSQILLQTGRKPGKRLTAAGRPRVAAKRAARRVHKKLKTGSSQKKAV